MKKVLIAVILFFSVAGAAMAQTTPKDTTKTKTKTMAKAHHHMKHHTAKTPAKKNG